MSDFETLPPPVLHSLNADDGWLLRIWDFSPIARPAVGIVIALLQALTQIQEITLTFIPKIIATLLVTSLMAPFIGTVIYAFAEQLYGRIQNGF